LVDIFDHLRLMSYRGKKVHVVFDENEECKIVTGLLVDADHRGLTIRRTVAEGGIMDSRYSIMSLVKVVPYDS